MVGANDFVGAIARKAFTCGVLVVVVAAVRLRCIGSTAATSLKLLCILW